MSKIKKLLNQIKPFSQMTYDIELGQYNLLKKTNASKQAFKNFEDDLEGALKMFQ